ncbi:MAG: rhodanese-like domain-containing protein [Candidatus Zixiibacteriota bacterium]
MKRNKLFTIFVGLMVVFALFVGCKGDDDDDDDDVSAYEAMTSYMTDSNLDLPDILDGWIIAADAVQGDEDNYYIMDIRADSVYQRGHLEGAMLSSLGTILDDAPGMDKPILVVCYTGQIAAHAVVALRLSGYADAKVLKFGMSSWNADFDKWTPNTGDIAIGHTNWTMDATAGLEMYSEPTITSSSIDGAAILDERIDAMLAGGFKAVASSEVLENPGNYHINNYWTQSDVDHYGHIVGAIRVKEDLTLSAGGFENLNPHETVVTYCWTGQTSSMVTAYLTILGYDAKSLKFGVNSMIHSELESHKWTSSADYDYVSGGSI